MAVAMTSSRQCRLNAVIASFTGAAMSSVRSARRLWISSFANSGVPAHHSARSQDPLIYRTYSDSGSFYFPPGTAAGTIFFFCYHLRTLWFIINIVINIWQ